MPFMYFTILSQAGSEAKYIVGQEGNDESFNEINQNIECNGVTNEGKQMAMLDVSEVVLLLI